MGDLQNMITNTILGLITTIVSGIDSLLPSLTLPAFFTGGSILPSSVIQFLAAASFMVEPLFPSGLVLSLLVMVTSLWPAVLAMLVFNWIYHHIPTIAGFGVGT